MSPVTVYCYILLYIKSLEYYYLHINVKAVFLLLWLVELELILYNFVGLKLIILSINWHVHSVYHIQPNLKIINNTLKVLK